MLPVWIEIPKILLFSHIYNTHNAVGHWYPLTSCKSHVHIYIIETREGWPLLTVETEVNGDSKGTKRGGFLSWLVRWACSAGIRDFCSALAALVGPVQNIFFPHHTLLQFLCPHRPAMWAGSRAGSPVS